MNERFSRISGNKNAFYSGFMLGYVILCYVSRENVELANSAFRTPQSRLAGIITVTTTASARSQNLISPRSGLVWRTLDSV